MKKEFFFGLFLFCALFFRCGDSEKPAAALPESLEIDRQNMLFAEKEAYGFFGITSNAPWSIISSDETWLTFSAASGEGNQVISVSVTANLSTETRTGSITVTSEGGIIRQVQVMQGEHEVTVVAPAVSVAGRNIWLIGTNLNLIETIWFGATKGTIYSEGRTNYEMRINIPATLDRGPVEMKVILSDNKEMTAGIIDLKTVADIEPFLTIPFTGTGMVKCAGEDLVFDCNLPSEVNELWFNDAKNGNNVKCVIKPPTSNDKLTVTIPAGTPQGFYEMKVVYNEGESEKNIGRFSVALNAGEYFLWENVTLYAQDYPGVEDKIFSLEYGLPVSICWVKEHEILINLASPGSAIGTGGSSPRGYRHLMLRGETDRIRIIDPNVNGIGNVFLCGGTPLTNYGLPPIKFIRIDNEPYRQNTANTSATGNTLHIPGVNELAFYNQVKNKSLTATVHGNARTEIRNGGADGVSNQVYTTPVSGTGNPSQSNNMVAEMTLFFDNYTTTINPAGGSGIYWYTLDQLKAGHQLSLHNGGIGIWAGPYDGGTGLTSGGNGQMNGAFEVVSWTGEPGAGATTGSVTLNIFRRKTWTLTNYNYNPNL